MKPTEQQLNDPQWWDLYQPKGCELLLVCNDPEGTETSSTGSKLYATMVRKANKFGWKVRGRKVDGGVRVWRIS